MAEYANLSLFGPPDPSLAANPKKAKCRKRARSSGSEKEPVFEQVDMLAAEREHILEMLELDTKGTFGERIMRSISASTRDSFVRRVKKEVANRPNTYCWDPSSVQKVLQGVLLESLHLLNVSRTNHDLWLSLYEWVNEPIRYGQGAKELPPFSFQECAIAAGYTRLELFQDELRYILNNLAKERGLAL